MFDVRFNEQEIKNITDNIKRLKSNYARNALRRALRKSARIIRDEARLNARRVDNPLTPEEIYKNIVIRGGRTRDKSQLRVRVGVLGGARNMEKYGEVSGKGKGNPGGDTWYWRFLEFGTSRQAAQPILRPAADNKAQEAFASVVKTMQEELQKEVIKRTT